MRRSPRTAAGGAAREARPPRRWPLGPAPGPPDVAEADHDARVQAVLGLRVRGLSWASVARELGYAGRAVPFLLVKKYLDEQRVQLAHDARMVLDVELASLDAMEAEAWGVLARSTKDMVRLKALDTLARLKVRRHTLLGLDAPQRVQSDVHVDGLSGWLTQVMAGEITTPAELLDDTAAPTNGAGKPGGASTGTDSPADASVPNIIDLTADDPEPHKP